MSNVGLGSSKSFALPALFRLSVDIFSIFWKHFYEKYRNLIIVD